MIPKNRINQLLEFLNLNPKSFANSLGYERGQIFYDILRGKTKSISCALADRIVSYYPTINHTWLLTGEGEMLNNAQIGSNGMASLPIPANRGEIEPRPILPEDIAIRPNVDVYEYVRNNPISNTSYVSINLLQTYDMCYRVSQDALEPDFKRNDILALAAMKPGAQILNGAPLVVDTYSMGFIFRYVQDKGDKYELTVTNERSNYKTTLLDKSDVIRVYRVVGMLRLDI